MLQKQYGIAGLQDVTMLQTLSMDVQQGEFVQILNVANSHWVTISTIGCEAGTVNDMTVRKKHVSYRNKEQVASLLFTERSTIKIKFMNVQIQYGSSDYLQYHFHYLTVWGHWPDYLHLQSTKHAAPLPGLDQQWWNEGIPNCKNPFTHYKACENWRDSICCTSRMPFNEQEAGEKIIMCYKCQEWFHDACLVKPAPEQYCLAIIISTRIGNDLPFIQSLNGSFNIEVTRSASGHSTEVLSHVMVGFGSVFSS